MSLFSSVFEMVMGPLLLLFDVIYAVIYRLTSNEGLSIIALSLTINFLILPLYKRADAMQEEERLRLEKMKRGVDHIKKVFKGDERFMMLQTYYRQNDYKPYYALNGSVSLLLEIPFFIAAFRFLSGLQLINGASFGPISDLGSPDRMLHIAGHYINLLPFLMTGINIISGVIYTKGMPLKNKIQLYGMALIFLVFLYPSPSGLVFYWTLNNLFSLVKNVFYKLKNPKRILGIMCALASGLLLVSDISVFQNKSGRVRMAIFVFALLLMVPLASQLLPQKYHFSFKLEKITKTDSTVFFVCCTIMTLLTGLLIPSAVISSSPSEFINVNDFHNPLRYLVHSFDLAAGTFLIWMSILYYFSSDKARKILSAISVAVSGAAIVDYMFYGRNYGNMSPLLQYDNDVLVSKISAWKNLLVLVGVVFLLLLVWKMRRQIYPFVCGGMCMTLVVMSCMNIFSINAYIEAQKSVILQASSAENIKIPLDKKGKNVMVIMIDRAMGDFVPYILNERPELARQFAGFTFYPNTITYGYPTMLGSQEIFGGYEYIPEEMDKRDSETLVEKRDEALKVLPKMFLDEGYEVTVCDPPYAGSYWIPDLSIYDEYPSVNAYLTKDRFSDKEQTKLYDTCISRNFFAYSLFRISPLLFHETIYNAGNYNQSDVIELGQTIKDIFRASGGFYANNSRFSGTYSVLDNLPEICDIRDSGQGTLLMLENDTPHDVVMLQEPEYEPSNWVDNSKLEDYPPVRYAADGSKLIFNDPSDMIHYQCNMAAMIKLGEWMDFLRESGVYDNTRIIITSDHGAEIDYLKSDASGNEIKESSPYSEFMAFLMVKDFDSKEFTVDSAFMTNADAPSLAVSGVIENPTNPFTGKKITTEIKNKEIKRIADTDYGILTSDYTRDEKVFKMINWVDFYGEDTSDLSAWKMEGD